MDVLSHKIKIKLRFANQSRCPPVVQNTCNIAMGQNFYKNYQGNFKEKSSGVTKTKIGQPKPFTKSRTCH